ncbi:MAG: hypothetical protein ACRDOK_24790, partial [Streptosporangiaceae bacterium]
NHSPAVEADHYLTAATPAQLEAVETIIEQAQADMVRRAATPVVVTGIELAGLARDFPAMVQRLGLEATEAGEIVSGVQDVFVAACSDPLSGLHGPEGQNCPARVWVCLLCPLAIFTPRHAANLLRMRSFFSRKWRAMPSAQFMATFGPYQARIEQVLQAYPATTLARAAAGWGEGSDDDLPLRPEERS